MQNQAHASLQQRPAVRTSSRTLSLASFCHKGCPARMHSAVLRPTKISCRRLGAAASAASCSAVTLPGCICCSTSVCSCGQAGRCARQARLSNSCSGVVCKTGRHGAPQPCSQQSCRTDKHARRAGQERSVTRTAAAGQCCNQVNAAAGSVIDVARAAKHAKRRESSFTSRRSPDASGARHQPPQVRQPSGLQMARHPSTLL